MGWKHQREPVAVPCTEKIVKEFSQMEPAPNDRPYNPTRATFIRKLIIGDTFRVAGFASVHCRQTKKTYRVNGKHTATVLGEMAGRYPSGLFAFVERYEADTLADVAKLYSSFDHKRSLRSSSDVNRAFAASSPDLAELPARIINVSATALAFAKWERDCFRHEAEERAGLLATHHDFVAWVAEHFPPVKNYRHLTRSAIVAAMFRTFQKNKKAASEFWQLVADESHPSNKHPTRVLARWLLTHTIFGGTHKAGMQYLDSTRGMYVRCLIAWNAWREGEKEVALKFYPDSETPNVL